MHEEEVHKLKKEWKNSNHASLSWRKRINFKDTQSSS